METKTPPTSGEEGAVESERSLIARLATLLGRSAPPRADDERRATDLREDDEGTGLVE